MIDFKDTPNGPYMSLIIKRITTQFEDVGDYCHKDILEILDHIQYDSKLAEITGQIYKAQEWIDEFGGDSLSEIEYFGNKIRFKEVKHNLKKLLPKFFPGSIFEGDTGSLATNSNYRGNRGLVLLDLDAKDNTNLDNKIELIADCKYTFVIWRSCSGEGFKVLVTVPATKTIEEFARISKTVVAYYIDNFDVKIDIGASCNPVIGTYLNSDHDVYINLNSELFNEPYNRDLLLRTGIEKVVSKDRGYKSKNYNNNDNCAVGDFLPSELAEEFFRQLFLKGFAESYSEWINLGMLINNIWGNGGKFYWDLLRDNRTSKAESDQKWKSIQKSQNGVTEATFWFHINNVDEELKSRIIKSKFDYLKKEAQNEKKKRT